MADTRRKLWPAWALGILGSGLLVLQAYQDFVGKQTNPVLISTGLALLMAASGIAIDVFRKNGPTP